jgi:hypothetical protein
MLKAVMSCEVCHFTDWVCLDSVSATPVNHVVHTVHGVTPV